MKRLLILIALAGCVEETKVSQVPVAPAVVEEPRRQFVDDNIPFDLTAGADITAIPDHWIDVFCGQPWESRAEPFTGIEQWNPCLRPDMFNEGPRPVVEEPAGPDAAPVEVEALAVADPLATAATAPIIAVETVFTPVQVVPAVVVPQAPPAAPQEFDIAPDPTLFLNPDGSWSRRSQ